ncbi:hypothetical protein Tco_0317010 [Tanacetum coccineum]
MLSLAPLGLFPSFDEFDKETESSDELQPMQADLSCVHALNEISFCMKSWCPRGKIIMESLVKKKQKGAILELKRRHLKNTIFCTYTPYPAMKIRRISASSAQETRNDQFPIRRKPFDIAMARPITNDYISATMKSFVSRDNNGKMIKKNFIEIEGKFLLKIHDNIFHLMDGEDVVFPISLLGATSKWFTNECIGTISTWNNLVEKLVLKLHDLYEHDEEEETNSGDYDPNTFDDVPEIFRIEDDLFFFDAPLCIAFEEFNHLFKIDPNLFTYDI